jgi:signal transduction histidine kinase
LSSATDRNGGEAGSAAPAEAGELRALVVDDDAVLLSLCVRALEGHGYRVEPARDGRSALCALRRAPFDVLVTDIQMPGMSGVELLEQVRADGFDIPAVLVTGVPQLDSAMQAINLGVLRYLTKPVGMRALVAVVDDVVRLHGVARAQRLALDNEALRSLVEELRRSKEAAVAGTRAKTEFLSKMGHELRAPMSTVIGMTGLALGTALSPEGRAYLETVMRSAHALMETLAHVLDFSDLDAGRLRLEMKPFGVRDVIEGVLKQLRPEAEAKGLALTSDVASALPDALIGDAVRFGLVVKTLVSNAIKFTNKGGVRLGAGLEASSDGDVCVWISIADTGIGIPADALKRVLDAFAQNDNSPTREYTGAGLGLTIASQLVALMRGALAIDSTPAVGTTLRFTARFEQVPEDDGFFLLDVHAPKPRE